MPPSMATKMPAKPSDGRRSQMSVMRVTCSAMRTAASVAERPAPLKTLGEPAGGQKEREGARVRQIGRRGAPLGRERVQDERAAGAEEHGDDERDEQEAEL